MLYIIAVNEIWIHCSFEKCWIFCYSVFHWIHCCELESVPIHNAILPYIWSYFVVYCTVIILRTDHVVSCLTNWTKENTILTNSATKACRSTIHIRVEKNVVHIHSNHLIYIQMFISGIRQSLIWADIAYYQSSLSPLKQCAILEMKPHLVRTMQFTVTCVQYQEHPNKERQTKCRHYNHTLNQANE